jgi:tellurite resistance protein TehA-like permease
VSVGASLFLIAAGAILALAVTGEVSGIDLEIVGWILMGVGALGLVLSFVFASRLRRRRRETFFLDDPYDARPGR